MSDDWQVNDLALCIHGGDETRKGAIYTVIHVHAPGVECFGWVNDTNELGLSFSELGIKPGYCSEASRFRKIHDHEPDTEDAETIYQLVYAPHPAFTDPTASELEAARSSSPRSATFPRLTGDALSFDNRSRQVAECDGAAVSDFPFHSPELRDV